MPQKTLYQKMKFIKVSEKTGVHNDYVNEFITCKHIVTKYEKDPKKAYELFKKFHPSPFVKYTDRRKKSGITFTITKKNKKQVKLLDRIVDELNSIYEDPSKFSCERVRTLTDRAYILIYGEKENLTIRAQPNFL